MHKVAFMFAPGCHAKNKGVKKDGYTQYHHDLTCFKKKRVSNKDKVFIEKETKTQKGGKGCTYQCPNIDKSDKFCPSRRHF